nr:hypothetical protein [uncultured Bariatricus sp.]
MKMPLPPGRARVFEAAGEQAVLAGREAAGAGLVSSADRAYMKAPVPRPPFGLRANLARCCV